MIIHPDEPRARDRGRFDLVAPYERDPARWMMVDWVDVETGKPHRITTRASEGRDAIRVRASATSSRSTAESAKPRASARGRPGSRETAGLLRRRSVHDISIRHIGKEANEIEEVAAGLISRDQATLAYRHRDPRDIPAAGVPFVRDIPVAQLVKRGVARRTVDGIRRGRPASTETMHAVRQAVVELLRLDDAPSSWALALAVHRDRPNKSCRLCGSPVSRSNRVYCSRACRQWEYRRRSSADSRSGWSSSIQRTGLNVRGCHVARLGDRVTLSDEIEAGRRTIKTDGYSMSVGELTNLYSDGELDVHPEFQRIYRWTPTQKTRLIESLLLGIPIPSVFVAQREDGVWTSSTVFSGYQPFWSSWGSSRTMRVNRSILLVLEGTRFLPSLEGRSWENEDESRSLSSLQRIDVQTSQGRRQDHSAGVGSVE